MALFKDDSGADAETKMSNGCVDLIILVAGAAAAFVFIVATLIKVWSK